MVVLGLSNKEIGAALGISGNTVRQHVTALMRRWNMETRVEIAVARDRGRS